MADLRDRDDELHFGSFRFLMCVCGAYPLVRWMRCRRADRQAEAELSGNWMCDLTASRAELCGGLAVRQLPVRSREVAVVAVRIPLEVVLVFGLGLPERAGRADR